MHPLSWIEECFCWGETVHSYWCCRVSRPLAVGVPSARSGSSPTHSEQYLPRYNQFRHSATSPSDRLLRAAVAFYEIEVANADLVCQASGFLYPLLITLYCPFKPAQAASWGTAIAFSPVPTHHSKAGSSVYTSGVRWLFVIRTCRDIQRYPSQELDPPSRTLECYYCCLTVLLSSRVCSIHLSRICIYCLDSETWQQPTTSSPSYSAASSMAACLVKRY